MTSAIFPGRRRKQPSARVELRIRRRSRELRPEPAELRGLLFRELAMIDSPGVPDQAGPPPRVAGGPWVRYAICRSWPATLSHRHEFQARRGPVESKQAGIGTFFEELAPHAFVMTLRLLGSCRTAESGHWRFVFEGLRAHSIDTVCMNARQCPA